MLAHAAVNRHCIAVAWSGGRDSTALLHATLVAAQPLGISVAALHVHHGLSPNADAWLGHCERQCVRWQRKGHAVSFYAERLADSPRPGQSVEAWARQARYRSLRHMALAHGATAVLLAHHRLDQAETFVLQALRGAGMPGLAGMPDSVQREGITWMRPWLNTPCSDIEAYVRRHRLSHIDDESNTDTRFARNRLRTAVWPALDEAFPAAEAALADAAHWAQQADACLRELADIDLAAIEDAEGRALRVTPLLALSLPRRSNALRHWLRRQLGRPAEASLVERLLQETANAGPHRWTTLGGELRHYRSRLTFSAADAEVLPSNGPLQTLSVKRAGCYDVPGWAGQLRVTRVREGGVPLAWLAHLLVKPRCGGEQFQAGLGRPARSLKKQFQAMGVPAWARAAPLFYSGGQLVFVPGLGIDARVIGLPGQAQMLLQWLPAPRPG